MNREELHEQAAHLAYHDHALGAFLHALIDSVVLADSLEAHVSGAPLAPAELEPDVTPAKGEK